MTRAMPSTASDPVRLLAGLRERINPAYADVAGTESHERRLCADSIERLLAEVTRQREVIGKINSYADHLGMSLGAIKRERDAMKAALQSLLDSQHGHDRTSEAADDARKVLDGCRP